MSLPPWPACDGLAVTGRFQNAKSPTGKGWAFCYYMFWLPDLDSNQGPAD